MYYSRRIGRIDLWANAKLCMRDFGHILQNSKGLLPKVWLPLIVLCIAVGVTLWSLGKARKWKPVIYYLLLVIALFLMVYILSMMQTQTYPRFVWTFYAADCLLVYAGQGKGSVLLFMLRLFVDTYPIL